ncbi:unnamed protein product [Mycena citricolor]|uniref:Chitin biosynthesis protein n=1 Tax=Mycena citricolor TaxID=2018698 RepID=A0AAD2HQ17_9AGAR|nr:unnamed protein product [Mycena citricolor]
MYWGDRKAEDMDEEGVERSENSDGRAVRSCRGPWDRTRDRASTITSLQAKNDWETPSGHPGHLEGCLVVVESSELDGLQHHERLGLGTSSYAPTTMEKDHFTFTVGKLDAGMAILLGERAHLIEFPSVLLPPGATTGSIVNISVLQNHAEEKRRDAAFWALQDEILDEFGVRTPEPPKLQLRNVTQTSVTLEWPPIELATAKLRSLDLYRNGQRLAPIPNPATNTSSKISGLELDTEYTFQLILRTTAGTFPSELLRVHTHTMTDTSGVRVCFGTVEDAGLVEQAKEALERIGARWSEKIEIDTTHFVCTTPNTHTPTGVPEVEYQRAVQLSIPIVQPHWIFACQSERRLVPIALFGLGATPPNALPSRRPQSMSAASPTQRSPASAAAVRQSMPPTVSPIGQPATFVGQSVSNIPPPTVPVVTVEEAHSEDEESDVAELEAKRLALMEKRGSKTGTMNMQFKFPPTSPTSPGPGDSDAADAAVEPESIEVPPPPVVEKETISAGVRSEGDVDDDLGETEDIPL